MNETEHYTHALLILDAIEYMESDDPTHRGREIVMDMGAATCAATSMALCRAVFGYWAEASGLNSMDLLQMIRQDLELKKDEASG